MVVFNSPTRSITLLDYVGTEKSGLVTSSNKVNTAVFELNNTLRTLNNPSIRPSLGRYDNSVGQVGKKLMEVIADDKPFRLINILHLHPIPDNDAVTKSCLTMAMEIQSQFNWSWYAKTYENFFFFTNLETLLLVSFDRVYKTQLFGCALSRIIDMPSLCYYPEDTSTSVFFNVHAGVKLETLNFATKLNDTVLTNTNASAIQNVQCLIYRPNDGKLCER